MKISLETERLLLRPWRMEDAEDMFYGWANDPEVTKYMTWNPHENIEQTKALLSQWMELYKKPERIAFAITLKDSNTLIGGVDVVGYIDGVPVIGYDLAKKYWNNGYMTEACKRVIDFLFSQGFNLIKIDAVNENIGSNKVIQKCGGQFIGQEIEDWPQKNCQMTINHYVFKKK